jgi:hypothetical protein
MGIGDLTAGIYIFTVYISGNKYQRKMIVG